MSNMSYVRFENTYADLFDCYESMDDMDEDGLSESEVRYRKKMIALCKKIVADFGDED